MTRFDGAFEPIAFSTRSGFDESLYHGAAVALGPDGRTIASLGDPEVAVYPRSSLKPMQATAMVECGLELPGDLLAIVCASHDGTAMHTAAVLEVLGTVGLDDSALRNTPSFALEEAARIDAERHGEGPTALHQNCSGKHAGMLATCCINGWPTDDYLDLEHPLQVAITASIEQHGAPVDHVGVDGCGALDVRAARPGRRSRTRCHSLDDRAAGARDEGRRGRRDGGGVPRRPGVRAQDRERGRRCTAGRDRASVARP